VFDWMAERATERQAVSTLATGYAGHNTTAEIVASPDGRFVYVSNRGQDSVVQFVVTADTGVLTYAATTPSGGIRPRFITLGPDASRLYVANQDSDEIVVFHVDRPSGSLIPTGLRIAVGSPSAIGFVTDT
jgi:6-phosphogluconolactonase (cycloisomerase 2 family)